MDIQDKRIGDVGIVILSGRLDAYGANDVERNLYLCDNGLHQFRDNCLGMGEGFPLADHKVGIPADISHKQKDSLRCVFHFILSQK